MCAILHSTSFPVMRKCVPSSTCGNTFSVAVYSVSFECVDDPVVVEDVLDDFVDIDICYEDEECEDDGTEEAQICGLVISDAYPDG